MMTAKNSHNKPSSVMLAADASSYSQVTVSLAVELAASANTRLHALFIEDEDLLQMTSLPCTREITLTTARERPTSSAQMQRSLRSVAQQFKKMLQQEAQALQIAWSFDTVRGRVRDLSLKTEADVSYTIVGQPLSYRSQARPVHGTRNILMIDNGSPYQKQALEMLLRRFRHQKINLTVITGEQKNEFLPQLAQRFKNVGTEVSLHELGRNLMDALINEAGSSFDCAIMSKRQEPGETLRILRKLRCPVILVA
jgi:nucleotide-binding universal stress UspA family protein